MRCLSILRAAGLILGLSLSAGAEAPAGMVLVPAGDFVMGTDHGNFDERPAHRVRLSAFYIDRHEVTVADFAGYVRATERYSEVAGPWLRVSAEGALDALRHFRATYGSPFSAFTPADSEEPKGRTARRADAARWSAARAALVEQLDLSEELLDAPLASLGKRADLKAMVAKQGRMPIRFVSWRDAQRYCRQRGGSLPSEAQWERAARGDDGRLYPWGDTWDASRCRTGLSPPLSAVYDPYRDAPREAGPAPVGSFPDGASPFGCLDMAGNVWEWTADWYGERYYGESEGTLDPRGPKGLPDGELPVPYSDSVLLRTPAQGRATDTRKVVRGGGWAGPPRQSPFNTRTVRRLWSNPTYWQQDVGFRCVRPAGD